MLHRSKHTTRSRTRRLLTAAGSVAAVASLASLVAGVSFARLSATTPTQTNHFSAGTVTLTSTVVRACSVTNVFPGYTNSSTPCQLQATYAGTVSAYLALDVLIATKSNSPGTTALYDPTNSTNDLHITVSDNQTSPVTYVTPATSFGTAITCPTGFSGFTCYQLVDLLVSTTSVASASAPITFSTAVTLPLTNPSSAQGSQATIVLSVHGTQSANQSIGSCLAGSACTTPVHWS
jgi:hypothetical protein